MTPVAAFDPAGRLARMSPAEELAGLSVHLIGMGGSGMSGLAGVLLKRGARVSGCDPNTTITVARLVSQGAQFTTHQTAEHLPPNPDVIVASAAVREDHEQLVEARRRGLRVMRYAEALGWLMSARTGVAISGTHGKSTTTAWLAYILHSAGLDPTFIVGGLVDQLGGGSGVGTGRHFVAEACEYAGSFLNLSPSFAAILNIEEDHLDYYPDIGAIEDAFCGFTGRLADDGLLVINGADRHCRTVAERVRAELTARGVTIETFGRAAGDTWQFTNVRLAGGRYSFDLLRECRPLGRVRLGPAGMHNVWNALAVAALAHRCGAPWTAIEAGLRDFAGVQRRMTLRGTAGGVRVIDDYGHHPTEIRATLAAIRERYQPRRLWCVFQPHQHSRTRFLLDDFATALTGADSVILPDIYFVRDSERDRQAVSARDLAAAVRDRGTDARYIPDFEVIADRLASEGAPGDAVVTMGAGDIWKVANVLLERIRGDHPG